VPTAAPWDGEESVSLGTEGGAINAAGAMLLVARGALGGQRAILALGHASAQLFDNALDAPPRVLDVVEETPLIGDTGQLAELSRELETEVRRMVEHGPAATPRRGIAEKVADYRVGTVHVHLIEAAATISLPDLITVAVAELIKRGVPCLRKDMEAEISPKEKLELLNSSMSLNADVDHLG